MRRLVLALSVLCASRAFGASLVLMPLDVVNGESAAASDLRPLIAGAVESKGWQIAATDISALLEERRVRYLDSIDGVVRDAILEQTGASAVLMVTVYTYSQGRSSTVALSAHLIDGDGDVIWANVTGLSSSDTERALGLGRKDSVSAVAGEAITSLMRDFPSGRLSAREWGAGALAGAHRRGRRCPTFVSPAFDASQPICVLPFDNTSTSPNAPRLLADVLALRLAAAGFNVVDPAALRAAALDAGVSLRGAGAEELAALAKILRTPLFLRGTVYAYVDPASRSGAPSPVIDVEATLVDANAGKVLWAAQNNRKGTDYIGFLMLGAVSNSVSLTDRVATEMIATVRTNHEASKSAGHRVALASSGRKSRQHGSGEGER